MWVALDVDTKFVYVDELKLIVLPPQSLMALLCYATPLIYIFLLQYQSNFALANLAAAAHPLLMLNKSSGQLHKLPNMLIFNTLSFKRMLFLI
jgi:hypothetical protein